MLLKRLPLLIVALMFSHSLRAQSSGSSSNQPSYRLDGRATLTSNFVEKGLTQTKGDPGVQSEFWFNFGPQFRLGLWGANVRYDSTPSTHFWLRANADIKVDFSENANLNIIYTENNLFKANNRNGNLVGLHFNFWGWKIIYDMESNWQGTQAKATYAGAGKDIAVWNDWIWSNTGGYLMSEAEGVTSFFDFRSGLGTKAKDILVMGSVSYSNASGAFKDQGELAFILSAQVSF
jgi:uncharacterized protein (TIGR02001 family)